MGYFAIGLIIVLALWFICWLAAEAIVWDKIAAKVALALSLAALIGWFIWVVVNEANARNNRYISFCQGVEK